MLTKDQLAARKIGGSDVATILGLNPYKTARELYHEKRGELMPENLDDNEHVEAGNIMEAPIAELVERRLTRRWAKPVKLRRCNVTLVNPKYDWLTVHIDRDFVGLERGLEIKNVGPRAWRGWGEQGTDQIPEHYLPQPHTYMLVKDYPVWTVAGYFGGGDLRIYEVQRDPDMDQLILDTTHDFWEKVIDEKSDPPEVDPNGPRALEVIKKLYPGTNGRTIEAGDNLLPWIGALREAVALKTRYETAEKAAKAHLLDYMADNAVLKVPGLGEYVRKVVKREGYVVEATSYVDFRFKKEKGAPDGDE